MSTKAVLSILAKKLSAPGWSIPFGMDSSFIFSIPCFRRVLKYILRCVILLWEFSAVSWQLGRFHALKLFFHCLMGRFFCVPEIDCSNSKAMLEYQVLFSKEHLQTTTSELFQPITDISESELRE